MVVDSLRSAAQSRSGLLDADALQSPIHLALRAKVLIFRRGVASMHHGLAVLFPAIAPPESSPSLAPKPDDHHEMGRGGVTHAEEVQTTFGNPNSGRMFSGPQTSPTRRSRLRGADGIGFTLRGTSDGSPSLINKTVG